MDEKKLETKKLLNFKPNEIKEYLKILKNLVLENKYIISKNDKRRENNEFIENYKINTKKEKEILMNLEYDDFCYAVNNKNPKFAHEVLYIFNKKYKLDKWGELILVDIYIKTNQTQVKSGDNIMIIVSFHERNMPIKYLFK